MPYKLDEGARLKTINIQLCCLAGNTTGMQAKNKVRIQVLRQKIAKKEEKVYRKRENMKRMWGEKAERQKIRFKKENS